MKIRHGVWIGLAALACAALAVPRLVADDTKPPEDKGDKPAAEKSDKPAAPARAEIGKPAPDFTLKSYDGKEHKLASLKDKVVVLEWFSKDCPACKMHLPTIKKLEKTYREKGVIWLAMDSTNYHTDEDNAKAAKLMKISYPILSDFDGKVGKSYGAKTTPHVFIVNKGTLVYAGGLLEPRGTKRPHVEKALDEILAGKSVSVDTTKPFG